MSYACQKKDQRIRRHLPLLSIDQTLPLLSIDQMLPLLSIDPKNLRYVCLLSSARRCRSSPLIRRWVILVWFTLPPTKPPAHAARPAACLIASLCPIPLGIN